MTYVGVFDSGVGGLSVVREIMQLLPAQPLIYLADHANAPYGQRPLAEIRALSEGITRFLLAQGSQAIVVACNTASAAALRHLRAAFPGIPFVGMEPAVKPAASRTRSGHVGVIATAATFQGELFASLLDRFANGIVVHAQACPELVPLVEAGELNTERTRAIVRSYLAPLLDAGIDELVLGCTHYPFLRPVMEEVVGPGVEIIDPAPAVARQLQRVLAQLASSPGGAPPSSGAGLGDADGLSGQLLVARAARRPMKTPLRSTVSGQRSVFSGPHRFYTSGDPARFRAALAHLLGLSPPVYPAVWDAAGELRPGMSAG